jgi:heme/copper-type cytochrome/quinol oxidase subunit 4
MILKLIGGVVVLLVILAGIYWIADNIRLNK